MNYYIYKFLNENNEVIYVGKTKDLYHRIYNHFYGGHLPKECYQSVRAIQYIMLPTDFDMDVCEVYYIHKYRPQYNTEYNNGQGEINTCKIVVQELEWINYFGVIINDNQVIEKKFNKHKEKDNKKNKKKDNKTDNKKNIDMHILDQQQNSDAKRRHNGSGTWGVKKVGNNEYKFYRDANQKYVYGKTEEEIKQKYLLYLKEQQSE